MFIYSSESPDGRLQRVERSRLISIPVCFLLISHRWIIWTGKITFAFELSYFIAAETTDIANALWKSLTPWHTIWTKNDAKIHGIILPLYLHCGIHCSNTKHRTYTIVVEHRNFHSHFWPNTTYLFDRPSTAYAMVSIRLQKNRCQLPALEKKYNEILDIHLLGIRQTTPIRRPHEKKM